MDAIREQDLLKRVGVAPANIITRKPAKFVTIQDPREQNVAKHIEAIPKEQGGSGFLFIIEVREVTPEQFKTILHAEKDMATPCSSIVSFRLRGRMQSDSDILMTVIECQKGDLDYMGSQIVKEYIAAEQDVAVEDIELCGVWGEKEKQEALTQ